jgi:hypothetical protein
MYEFLKSGSIRYEYPVFVQITPAIVLKATPAG